MKFMRFRTARKLDILSMVFMLLIMPAAMFNIFYAMGFMGLGFMLHFFVRCMNCEIRQVSFLDLMNDTDNCDNRY